VTVHTGLRYHFRISTVTVCVFCTVSLISQLCNYQLKSLDFVINRFFMKLFRTSNIHVVSDCQEQFNFVLPSVHLARRAKKFANKLHVD